MNTVLNAGALLFVGLIVLVVLLGLASSMIRIAREYERLVLFRLGRCLGERGPGLVILIPFIDTAVKVDQREQFMEVPQQTAITRDNAPINIDFLIYWKVFSPKATVLQVGNFAAASQGIATTTLRAVIGDLSLDDVLAQRERINNVMRTKLDEVTERWGVKVTAVEIREIVPPRDVQEAMNRQVSAERTRRAVVTEAEGKREAAITVATGDKQASILKAEGQKQAQILSAEGERQGQALRAQGYADALSNIFAVAKGVDANTMALQYMEALKSIGAGASTKYILPLELTRLAAPIADAMAKASGQ
jgi:regulator of protease activity HflC (stomatin/prohibitin superfamily)